jgi:hypothetical protein
MQCRVASIYQQTSLPSNYGRVNHAASLLSRLVENSATCRLSGDVRPPMHTYESLMWSPASQRSGDIFTHPVWVRCDWISSTARTTRKSGVPDFVVQRLFCKQNWPASQFLHQRLCETIVHCFDDTAHDLFDETYGMASMAYFVRRCTRIPVKRCDKSASSPR